MKLDFTAIVVVSERYDDPAAVYREYRDAIDRMGARAEFIYVLDGEHPDVSAPLLALRERGEPITVLQLLRWYGEATAITIAANQAGSKQIVLLPAYRQVDPSAIPRLLERLDECDVVIGYRCPRQDPFINKMQGLLFNALAGSMTGVRYRDLGCAIRAIRRNVLLDLKLYGDQHRFLPILAEREGFRVCEVAVPQAAADAGSRIYRAGTYVRRLLDLLAILFLVKFIQKPLRFFGLLGFSSGLIGGSMLAFLALERLVYGVPLAGRPLLIISTMMAVLGVQLIAVGLLGEVIIFTRGRAFKTYRVEKIIRRTVEPPVPANEPPPVQKPAVAETSLPA